MEIRLHDHAKSDLQRMYKETPELVGSVQSILEEMRDDPEFQDVLLVHDHTHDLGEILAHVSRWEKLYRKKLDIWRLKPIESVNGRLLPYRIIYAYRPPNQGFPPEVWVLAVLPRSWSNSESFNYEKTPEYMERIIKDYDNLV